MHAEDLLIDEGTDRQNIEDIGEGFPKFEVVFPFAYDRIRLYIHRRTHKFD